MPQSSLQGTVCHRNYALDSPSEEHERRIFLQKQLPVSWICRYVNIVMNFTSVLKWSSRPIWKGVCVLGLALGLTNIYLLNFTYDNNTVEMVSKTHLERRVLGLVLGLTNIHTLHFTDDNNANTV